MGSLNFSNVAKNENVFIVKIDKLLYNIKFTIVMLPLCIYFIKKKIPNKYHPPLLYRI